MIPWAEIETRMRNVPSTREAEEFVRYEGKGLYQNERCIAVLGTSDQHKSSKKSVDIPVNNSRLFKKAWRWWIGRMSASGRV
jgi:hypothetical protein